MFLGWDDAARKAEPPERPDVAQTQVIPKTAGPDLQAVPATTVPGERAAAQKRASASPSPSVESPAVTSAGVGPGSDPTKPACPECGRANEPGRRFCAKCGFALAAVGPARPAAVSGRKWWQRFSDPQERQARRAYRHSLPPLYRWRRVVIGVLTPVALFAMLAAVNKDPQGWAKARWYDLKKQTVPVTVIKAVVVPRRSAIQDYPADSLVDSDPGQAWATRWVPPKKPPVFCGGAPKVGQVLLTLPPTRIRQIQLKAGVTDRSQRPLQLLPATLDVTFSDNSCYQLTLKRTADWQTLDLDSKNAANPTGIVTSVRIGVTSTFPPRDKRARSIVAISEIILRSRPPVHDVRTGPVKAFE